MMRSDSAAEAAFTSSVTSTGSQATGSVTTVLCDTWYSSHIWRRRVGLPPVTELGLARIASPDFPSIIANYANQFADGRPVKSTSIGIKDISDKYVAALCLNVDMTLFPGIQRALAQFTEIESSAVVEHLEPATGSEAIR